MKSVASLALYAGTVMWAYAQIVSAGNAATFQETVLYSFCGQTHCTDGARPYASLIDVNGTLYGTTAEGGGYMRCISFGCGTMFSLDPNSAVERVVHSFCSQPNCADGAL